MSEAESLLLVLALLYLLECVGWIRRGAVVFRTRGGPRWSAVHPGLQWGNQRGGLILAHPLPPLGGLVLSAPFPFSLSPTAVLAFVAPAANPGGRPPQRGSWLRWEQITAVAAAGRELKINGAVWCKFASAHTAHHCAAQLQTLARLPVEQRAAAIRTTLAAPLDLASARAQWDAAQPALRKLRGLGNSLFVFVFLVAPGLFWLFGIARCWPVLVVGWLGHTVTIATVFFRAHRRLYPVADEERFTHFLTSLLAAPTAIRAHDLLARPLLERFHPLVVAQLLATPAAFQEVARDTLRELRFPARCGNELGAEAAAIEKNSRELLHELIVAALRRAGLEPDSLLVPPVALDASCRAYCPRCEAQFTTASGTCADCGGLPLLPLPKWA